MHGECRFVDPFVIRVLDDSVGEDMGDTVKLNVAIAGASGLVGGHCVDELLVSPRVESVLSVARREGAPREGLSHQVVSFDAPFSLLRNVDVGFSALGTTIKKAGSQAAFRAVDLDANLRFAEACKAAGCSTFVLVSSLGASSKSRVFYNKIKGEAEEGVRALGFRTTVILRPSILVGERNEQRAGEGVGLFFGNALAPLMVGSLKRYRPIHAKVVAKAMAASIQYSAGVYVFESEELADRYA